MRDASHGGTPFSLTELPLNVLFQVLWFLDREELRNVAKCCRMLRLLANENLMLTNSLVELHAWRNQWNRRLLYDVFDILNGSRNLLLKLTFEHNVSIFESVQYVQQRYELECQASGTQMLLLRNEDPDFVEDVRNANEDYKRNDGKMTYLKILQGFHNLALAAQESKESEVSRVGEEEVEPVETPVKNDDSESTLKQSRTISPAASNYSKSSAASIFSDLPPKLSDRGWHSSIYELEHVSDHTDASNSEADTSSSTESIVRLRNSNKVKDKAALFEKLFSKDYELMKSPKKCRKKKSYGVLTATIGPDPSRSRPESNKRSISQGYLEELERCNLFTPPSACSDEQTMQRPILKYQDHVLNEYDVDIKTLTTSMSDDTDRKQRRPRARVSQRSKLTAFVTEDNKICYEKS